MNYFSLKIGYIGLNNETPYGVMKFLQVAEKFPHNLKILSVQLVWVILSPLREAFSAFSP